MIEIDTILTELSARVSTGILDLRDPFQRFELSHILNEYGFSDDVIVNVIDTLERRYLTEAPKTPPAIAKPKKAAPPPQPKGFSAISKQSGKKVYFQSKDSMNAAIEAGTHTAAKSSSKPVTGGQKKTAKKDTAASGGGAASLAAKIAGGAKKDAKQKEKAEAEKAKKAAAKKTPKVKPQLIKAIPVVVVRSPEKNKGLGPVNTKQLNSDLEVGDVAFQEMLASKKLNRVKATGKVKLPVIPGFPKKYTKFIQRVLSVEKIDEVRPPLSMLYGQGGAGHISSQSAEVLMMMFAKLETKEAREKFRDDLISYVASVDKSSKIILDKSWITAAYLQAESLHARLMYTHPSGYSIEQVAWDNKLDVEALGLRDYKNNKGASTDVYFRIKPNDGDSYLLEDSLKKDENVFLLNTSTSEIAVFAIKKLPKDIQSEYKELLFRYTYEQLRPSEKTRIFRRIEQIKDEAEKTLDPSISPKSFRKQQYDSVLNFSNSFEQYVARDGNKRVVQKLDDKALMRAFGSKKADKDFAISAVKALNAGKFGTPEYAAQLKKLSGKIGDRYITKAGVYAAEYFSALGNGNLKTALEQHYGIAKTFQGDYLISISNDPELRDGLMERINDAFPLRSLFEGEEQADIDSLPVFRESLTNMFKTKSYDELKTHLVVRKNEKGSYELVYTTSNKYEAIPIATIGARQRGVGYDQVMALEMYLHPVFAQRIAKSNAELGIMTPGIKKQLEKMGGNKPKTSKTK